jgi:hypothetical protein
VIVVTFIQQHATVLVRGDLQADVGLRGDETGGQLQIGLSVDEVDTDQRLAALALVAMETLAAGVRSHDHALRPVQALVVVTGAGSGKDHGRRELTEQPAVSLWTDTGVSVDCVDTLASILTLVLFTVIKV